MATTITKSKITIKKTPQKKLRKTSQNFREVMEQIEPFLPKVKRTKVVPIGDWRASNNAILLTV